MSAIVIAGAGHAAGQAAATLRQKGFDGDLVVVGDEPHIPYQRPPLSKAYLLGKESLEHLYVRQPAFLEKQRIDVRSGVTVTAIDTARKTLATSDGDIDYGQLLLTTGARPREIQVPGAGLRGVHYLRTIGDVDRIRAGLESAQSVCIVGGGYIGLEVAAACRQLGKQVTVLEMADRVLQRVAVPELSRFYHDLHTANGVDIHVNAKVSEFVGDTRVSAVRCGDVLVDADLVVIGIGIIPNTELAADAGLTCDNGIVVDEYCRTSDPSVFAAGDCTNHPNPQLGYRLRLESVPNALDQARVAAANLLGGSEVHDSVPWFWSDQYGLKLQMVGFAQDADEHILRGSMADHAFALYHLKGNTIVAVDAVNQPREFLAGKKLFCKSVDVEQLRDPDIETRTLVELAGDPS